MAKGVVGAPPTGDATKTPERATILVPTEVRLILEVWRQPANLYAPYAPYKDGGSLNIYLIRKTQLVRIETQMTQAFY